MACYTMELIMANTIEFLPESASRMQEAQEILILGCLEQAIEEFGVQNFALSLTDTQFNFENKLAA
jgi:hypothetical protein